MPTLETITAILAALVGWPLFVALVIDILKYFGIVNDGTAPKWNLGFNLIGFVLVGVALGFFPDFDIPGFDAVLLEYVKVAAYIFTILVQIFGAKFAHGLLRKTSVGKKYFTYSGIASRLSYPDSPF